jgi:general stress protein YciG
MTEPSRTHLRGFASLSPERRKEIATLGGASVPADRRSFSQNRELARMAGKKGGEASHGGRAGGVETGGTA